MQPKMIFRGCSSSLIAKFNHAAQILSIGFLLMLLVSCFYPMESNAEDEGFSIIEAMQIKAPVSNRFPSRIQNDDFLSSLVFYSTHLKRRSEFTFHEVMDLMIPQRITQAQQIIGASNFQIKEIQYVLATNGFTFDSLKPNTSVRLGLDWVGYDVWNEEGVSYLLILEKESLYPSAILSPEGQIMWGIIDNSMLPDYNFDAIM